MYTLQQREIPFAWNTSCVLQLSTQLCAFGWKDNQFKNFAKPISLLNKNEVKMVSEVPMTVFAGRKLCAIDFQLAYFFIAVH